MAVTTMRKITKEKCVSPRPPGHRPWCVAMETTQLSQGFLSHLFSSKKGIKWDCRHS